MLILYKKRETLKLRKTNTSLEVDFRIEVDRNKELEERIKGMKRVAESNSEFMKLAEENIFQRAHSEARTKVMVEETDEIIDVTVEDIKAAVERIKECAKETSLIIEPLESIRSSIRQTASVILGEDDEPIDKMYNRERI